MTRNHEQKQFGENSVYLTYTSTLLFILKEVRTGSQEQGRIREAGADGEVRKVAVFWLTQAAFIDPGTTSPEMAPPIMGPLLLLTN